MLFYGMLGVVIGGRLGEVLFYRPEYFCQSAGNLQGLAWRHVLPRRLPRRADRHVWGRKAGRNLLDVYDFIAPLVPLGYAAGRLGNFINAELPGRVPRHRCRGPCNGRASRIPCTVAHVPDAGRWPAGVRDPVAVCAQRPRMAVGAIYTLLYGCALLHGILPHAGLGTTVLGMPITSARCCRCR
jgi:phosphatidylglycerol:prolipoprotein diacylglycerol transferase